MLKDMVSAPLEDFPTVLGSNYNLQSEWLKVIKQLCPPHSA